MKSLVERLQEQLNVYQKDIIATVSEEILEKEAKDLKKLIYDEIKFYYDNSYSPVAYNRTYGLLNSLYIGDLVTVKNNSNISVKFKDELAYGNSLFDWGKQGYKPALINYGWQVKKKVAGELSKEHLDNKIGATKVVINPTTNHLGYQEGAFFLEKAVEEYNRTNKYGLKAKINN
jgi:hypothetical protein